MPPSSKKRGRAKHQSPSVLVGSIFEATSEEPPKKKPSTPPPKKKPNQSAAVKAVPPPKKPQPKFKPTKSPNASSVEATSLKNSPVKPASPSHADKKQQPTPPAKKKSAPSAATVEAVSAIKLPPIIEPSKSPTATASKVEAGEDTKPKAASGQCKQSKPTERDMLWEKRYGELVGYKAVNGNCDVPQKFPKLGLWVKHQRAHKKKGKLTDERKRKLDDIGFDFDTNTTLWNQRYGELVSYKVGNGNCDVPQNLPKLREWATTQRVNKKKGELTEERIRKLDDIGFDFDPYATAWNKQLNELEQFKSVHGHCNVPRYYDQNVKLGVWVDLQRVQKRKGVMCEERVETLNTLDFTWDPQSEIWDLQYEALREFKNEYGDCNVPTNGQNPKLGAWVKQQRFDKKKGNMCEERIEKLNTLNFTWDVYSELWNLQYEALQEFKSKYGDCNVPINFANDSSLGKWVNKQRTKFENGEMEQDRLKQLNKIGFKWTFCSQTECEWIEQYNELILYKRQHNHSKGPVQKSKFSGLANWIMNQRCRKNELDKKRLKLLDEIGFAWKVSTSRNEWFTSTMKHTAAKPSGFSALKEDEWMDHYNALKAFNAEYGHFNVPLRYVHNEISLGRWVKWQNEKYDELGKLPKDRQRLLEEIGFVCGSQS